MRRILFRDVEQRATDLGLILEIVKGTYRLTDNDAGTEDECDTLMQVVDLLNQYERRTRSNVFVG